MRAVLSERTLLRLLSQGFGAKEIASRTGLDEEHVRDLVVRVLRTVASREQPDA